jgi:hypothetical protein
MPLCTAPVARRVDQIRRAQPSVVPLQEDYQIDSATGCSPLRFDRTSAIMPLSLPSLAQDRVKENIEYVING